MSASILNAIDLSYQVPIANRTLTILNGVNLTINAGETIAIMGASGSGKTTLLSLMAGLEPPTQGRITLLDKSIENMTDDERALHRMGQVGFIFQTFDLLPYLSALENVMLPLELLGHADAQQQALEILQEVKLGERLNNRPSQLSGGEQQRVAIARAFVTQPKIIFADEPTGSLDEETGQHILSLLFDINRAHQTTLVFVTHEADIAKQCLRAYHLAHGQLTQMNWT